MTAEEIKNLEREAQALNEIRSSMGSDDFPRKVFEKVFKTDIERLRQMEDMWKERKRPEPLDFEKLQEESAPIAPTVSIDDQKVWTLAENFVVFKDRWANLHFTTRSQWLILIHEQPGPPEQSFAGASRECIAGGSDPYFDLR